MSAPTVAAVQAGAQASTEPAGLFPWTFGLIHAVVDAVTVTAVYSTIVVHDLTASWAFFLVIAYDLMAFAGQAPLGWLVDRFRFSRGAILTGLASCALAVALLTVAPYPAIIAAGIGNALFHVGAGALSLYVRPGRASPPAIFVAPGALGLGLGLYLGKEGNFHLGLMLGALAVAFLYSLYSRNPKLPEVGERPTLDIRAPALVIGLLLFSIFVRSLVGYSGGRECPKLDWIPLAFVLASFAGKGLGGIVSDKLGWIRVSVGALLISAPLIAFFGHSPWLLVAGLFLFQMTMPVTLVAIAAVIPGRPGFAFGMACLVLVLGALPTFFEPVKAHFHPGVFLALILLSAGVLYLALGRLREKVPMRF